MRQQRVLRDELLPVAGVTGQGVVYAPDANGDYNAAGEVISFGRTYPAHTRQTITLWNKTWISPTVQLKVRLKNFAISTI